MSNYSPSKVNKYNKLLVAQENYWDEELSVEFCIARRTRDILLGRSIANNLVQGKRSANGALVFDAQVENTVQEYFSTYIHNEATISDFWGIFIIPSEKFVAKYTKFDDLWWPKFAQVKQEKDKNYELKEGLNELLALFRDFRNVHFWENEKEWEWFFNQYLSYLANNLPEQVCRDGLGGFISVIVKMQTIVEASGWKIDYGLHDSPLKVWAGQSWRSSFFARIKARKFENRVRKELDLNTIVNNSFGSPKKNISNFFAYLAAITVMICVYLSLFFFIDIVISSLTFLVKGYWASTIQDTFKLLWNQTDIFEPETWRINTGLIGLDYLINEFISLQFSSIGRWKMFGVSAFFSIIFILIAFIFNFKIFESSLETSDKESIPWLLGALTSVALLAPLLIGVFLMGVISFIFKLFGIGGL